jgi:hypothetical protein
MAECPEIDYLVSESIDDLERLAPDHLNGPPLACGNLVRHRHASPLIIET